MTIEHPITPPPELVQQWYDNIGPDPGPFESFAIAAARWGADQELEACCELVQGYAEYGDALLKARRPKPPSLKDRALVEMEILETHGIDACCLGALRRALEALPE